MKFSDNCASKLKEWISAETWHTNHDLDMGRFYSFVDAYEKDHGCHISDESQLAETIASHANISTQNPLFDEIRQRVSLMYNILDFLKATNR